ncbi:hypothetical protein EYF80_014179 [Liparis tanakae]|uniref:Uncharacterized protein n=1 Tax=Liparis tanakae TaxID=230148 RepID=A0A4Z2IC61_9TELE|nr:hypothetical protein EYF80_014179 [Liparis tanakae]
MSAKSVKVEEFAGLVAIAAGLHLTTEQDVTAQQAHLRPHVHPVHFLTHSVLATTIRSRDLQFTGWSASSRMLLLDDISMEIEACGRTTDGDVIEILQLNHNVYMPKYAENT